MLKNINPDYHDLIKEFYKILNIPLLLIRLLIYTECHNENAHQAINTFIKSDLDIYF